MANGRCRMHGGVRPVGIAHPGFKTGRYSKHLPSRMLANYEAAKSDPELLAMRDEVSLIDARLADLLDRAHAGESAASWRAVQETYQKFRTALARKDLLEMSSLIQQFGAQLSEGVGEAEAWDEIRACIEQRRKLVESERKRLIEMQQMVDADQAMALVRSLVASVREHVHDPAILRAITADLGRLSLARAD